jgi:predicted ABC-type ATPase
LKHPKGSGGKFIDVLGRQVAAKGRGGKKVATPKPPRLPREPAMPGAERAARGAGRKAEAEPGKGAAKEPKVQEPNAAAAAQDVKAVLKQAAALGLDDPAEKGAEATRILGDAKDTQALHTFQVRGKTGSQRYTPERLKLHDKIIDTLLRQRMEVTNPSGQTEMHPNPNGEFLKPGAADGGKKVLFMAGGTASGKSTALASPDAAALVPPDAVHVNPDEIKTMIPEYVQMVRAKDRYAASGVHEESSDIAKRLLSEATTRGLPVVRDGTGDSKEGKFSGQIKDMKDAGYDVHILYSNAPTDVAIARTVARAERTGRWVPEAEVRSQHENVSARFPEVRALVGDGTVSSISMFQTEGPVPKLFASGGNGSFNIDDAGLYGAFLAKATEGTGAAKKTIGTPPPAPSFGTGKNPGRSPSTPGMRIADAPAE